MVEAKVVTVRAPGKIILSGEHAVVYGAPALVVAVDRFVTTQVSSGAGDNSKIEVSDGNSCSVADWEELGELQSRIDQRYQEYLNHHLPITAVLKSPQELVFYTLNQMLKMYPNFSAKPMVKIAIHCELPRGCGMGSSAAVIVTLLQAIASSWGNAWEPEQLFRWGRAIENLQHGYSSGVDIFTSIHGGSWLYSPGLDGARAESVLDLLEQCGTAGNNGGSFSAKSVLGCGVVRWPTLPMFLVNTGLSQSSTGECVAYVAARMRKAAMVEKFTQVTRALTSALQREDQRDFQLQIRQNHRLLQELGVVPEQVGNFIQEIEARGGAAKVCGAGAISGEQGGVVLVVGVTEVADLIAQYGYAVLPWGGIADGISLISS